MRDVQISAVPGHLAVALLEWAGCACARIQELNE